MCWWIATQTQKKPQYTPLIDCKKREKKRKEHKGCGILCVSVLFLNERKKGKNKMGVCGGNVETHKHNAPHTSQAFSKKM